MARRGRIESAVYRQIPADSRPLGLSQAALALARRLDGEDVDDRDFAALSRELRATLIDLGKIVPAEAKGDAVDDLAGRRQARRAAG